jgi:hypothetical protein
VLGLSEMGRGAPRDIVRAPRAGAAATTPLRSNVAARCGRVSAREVS